MTKVNSLLSKRLKSSTEKPSKMAHLAELSSKGELSSFSGVFRTLPISAYEQEKLGALLSQFAPDDHDVADDLNLLINITTEVKAIHHQSALLHGERIKKVQEALKHYKDGAFSGWLINTYGNRQTPYNFLHYFELYESLPAQLKTKVDEMPRQAVYSLASRSGKREKKEEIIESYQGETKQQLLALIRETFPLSVEDKRNQNLARFAIQKLSGLHLLLKSRRFQPSAEQKKALRDLLKKIEAEIP